MPLTGSTGNHPCLLEPVSGSQPNIIDAIKSTGQGTSSPAPEFYTAFPKQIAMDEKLV
jgi:hypothetical protein